MDFNPQTAVSAGGRLLVVGFGHPVCGELPTERLPLCFHNFHQFHNFLHNFLHFHCFHNLHGRVCCGSNGFTIVQIVGWFNGGKLFLEERGEARVIAVALRC
jgi:hypothetical protein